MLFTLRVLNAWRQLVFTQPNLLPSLVLSNEYIATHVEMMSMFAWLYGYGILSRMQSAIKTSTACTSRRRIFDISTCICACNLFWVDAFVGGGPNVFTFSSSIPFALAYAVHKVTHYNISNDNEDKTMRPLLLFSRRTCMRYQYNLSLIGAPLLGMACLLYTGMGLYGALRMTL